LRVFEDVESQLARGLFGKTVEERWLEYAAIADLVGFIATHDAPTPATAMKETLKEIATRVAQREMKFAGDLNSLIRVIEAAEAEQPQDTRPEVRAGFREFIFSEDGPRLIAKTRVTETARQLGVVSTANELEEYSRRVLRAFPTAIYFLRDLLADLIDSGLNVFLSRNSNSVWDLSLAFHASREASVDGVPVLLVSDDARIERAAAGAAQPEFVRTLLEYEFLLSSGEIDDYAELLRASS
jgi:hypothetical protein